MMGRRFSISIYTIAIICLLSYFWLGELKSLVYPNRLIWIASLVCGVLIFFSRLKRWRITKYEMGCFLTIFLFVLLRNRYLENGEFDINVIYYFLLVFLIVCMRSNVKWVKSFVNFVYWISLIHAVATLFFALSPSSFNWYTSHFLEHNYYVEVMARYRLGTISGLCVNYGVNAGILAMGTGVAVVRLMWSDRGIYRKRDWFPVLIRLAGLLFTGKRSPVLLMVVSIALIYVFIEKGKANSKIVKIVLAVVASIVLVYIGSMFIPQLQVLFGRLMDSDDWSTLGGRTVLYELAMDMWHKNPLFGQGWNSYKLTSALSIGKIYASQYSRMQAHNVYLQLLSEVGVTGLVAFIAIFLYPLLAVFYGTRKFGLVRFLCNNAGEKKELLSVIYMLLLFLLYGMTGNPLYDAYMYFVAFMCCGALQSYLVVFKNSEMKRE